MTRNELRAYHLKKLSELENTSEFEIDSLITGLDSDNLVWFKNSGCYNLYDHTFTVGDITTVVQEYTTRCKVIDAILRLVRSGQI